MNVLRAAQMSGHPDNERCWPPDKLRQLGALL
jgi:hypothetical protein